LPYRGDWYLIIYNPNNAIAAVSYDVYWYPTECEDYPIPELAG
jgi:hypothetical protein